MLAPAGIPPAIMKKLSDTVKMAMQNPELLSKFKDSGMTPKFTTPEDYAALLARNYTMYGKAVGIAKVPAN